MNESSENFVDEVLYKSDIKDEIESYTGIKNPPSAAFNALENLAKNREQTSVDKSWLRVLAYQENGIVNESEEGYYINTEYLKDPKDLKSENLPYQI